ncbi:MAG: hypothetical protein OCD76_08600 [Reichenbachiella sp.]
MKSILGIIIFMAAFTFANAQSSKVKERDLRGIWQLKIDLGDDFLEDEIEDEENAFARIILETTGSLVTDIIEEIDVKFEFLPDNVCKVYASAFDSDREVEYVEWEINNRGQLIISDSDSYESDGIDYWMLEDDVLVAMEDGDVLTEDVAVYLVKLD